MPRRLSAFLFSVCILSRTLHADVIVDWNAIASETMAASGQPGPVLPLHFATMHIAIHDAVQAFEGRYRPYAAEIAGAAGSPEAAAATAAHDVLVARFRPQAATIHEKYLKYLSDRGLTEDDPGVEVGKQAAAAIIALRTGDGSFPVPAPPPFTGGGEPGMWRPTPSYLPGSPAPFSPMAAPWLAEVTPFAVKSPSQFRAKKLPEMTSKEYTDAFNEVKSLGASSGGGRTPEQTDIAYFWSDNTPLQWNRALRGIAAAHIDDLGDSARLFALANIAAADALITCWDTKLHYNFWRPVTAIQHAAEDGNPDTEPDPDWKPLLNTPNYPDYSSGANNVTGAMTRVLQLLFETDHVSVAVTSNSSNLPVEARTRTFDRFSDIADEVVEARIYLGYHFRFADTAARDQGRKIAQWAVSHTLKPVDD